MEDKVKAKELDMQAVSIKRKAEGYTSLAFLKPHQVTLIDDALCALGAYGEVRLVVENGRLRYLVVQRSYDVMKLDGKTLLDLG